MRQLIGSFLFAAWLPFWTVFISTIGLPCVLIGRAHWIGAAWGFGSLFGLRVFCNIRFKILGQEHLPKPPFIIASRHESAWETMIFLTIHPTVAYVLKKELLRIPFFGQYLVFLKMIAVDRSAGASALKSMLKQAKSCIEKNRVIVIYPEGTRMKPYERRNFHPGISALHSHFPELPIVPVALNSGAFWRRGKIYKKPGFVLMEYGPALTSAGDKKKWLADLQNDIITRSESLHEKINSE
jgi:1-acyl-sn-glycerol-3-phosphate acyltransferase